MLKAAGGSADAASGGSTVAAGIDVDDADPLAVLDVRAHAPPKADDSIWLKKEGMGVADLGDLEGDGTRAGVASVQQGQVVELLVQVGDSVTQGQDVLVLSAMKMEHVVSAPASGTIESIDVAPTDTVQRGGLLMVIAKDATDADGGTSSGVGQGGDQLDVIRADLEEVFVPTFFLFCHIYLYALERRRRILRSQV